MSKRVTYATKANGTPINYQVADTANPTGNIIYQIGAADESALINCSTNSILLNNIGNTTTLNNTGGQITMLANNFEMNLLPNATKPNVVFYDTATKFLSYGPTSSFVNGPIAVNYTANTIPINSASNTLLQAVIVPANTFTGTLGETIRLNASGRINISAVSVGTTAVKVEFNNVIVSSLSRSGAVPVASTNDYTVNGYFTITSYSAPNAVFKYSIMTQFADGNNDSNVNTGTTAPVDISSLFNIRTFGTTVATSTITEDILKIWKE